MQKKFWKLIPLCVLSLAAVWCFAAADAGDPLISLSHLRTQFLPSVEEKVEQKLDQSDEKLLNGQEEEIPESNCASTWIERRMKQGDQLLAEEGTNVMVLAGGMKLELQKGTVVDVTTGKEVGNGTALELNHRYLAAEETAAAFAVTSRTAVVDYQGNYMFRESKATDYNAMASALKSLHLFKGSFTGFGEGFDLEVAPTRLQALIMFIRVLGEEDQALSWTGGTHFTDVKKGSQAEKYIGYAFSKGYTNGYSKTEFKPARKVNAWQYTEFILRAMGYSSAQNTNISDALSRAQKAGILTSGEVAVLEKGQFLRADLVYVSYYALQAKLADSENTLSDLLQGKGVFSDQEWKNAKKLVNGSRI